MSSEAQTEPMAESIVDEVAKAVGEAEPENKAEAELDVAPEEEKATVARAIIELVTPTSFANR